MLFLGLRDSITGKCISHFNLGIYHELVFGLEFRAVTAYQTWRSETSTPRHVDFIFIGVFEAFWILIELFFYLSNPANHVLS